MRTSSGETREITLRFNNSIYLVYIVFVIKPVHNLNRTPQRKKHG